MTERDTLIQNIVYSEVDYVFKKKALLTETKPERIAELKRYIAEDEAVIATWISNFGITEAEINAKRESFLAEYKNDEVTEKDRVVYSVNEALRFAKEGLEREKSLAVAKAETLEEKMAQIELFDNKIEAKLTEISADKDKVEAYCAERLAFIDDVFNGGFSFK